MPLDLLKQHTVHQKGSLFVGLLCWSPAQKDTSSHIQDNFLFIPILNGCL